MSVVSVVSVCVYVHSRVFTHVSVCNIVCHCVSVCVSVCWCVSVFQYVWHGVWHGHTETRYILILFEILKNINNGGIAPS